MSDESADTVRQDPPTDGRKRELNQLIGRIGEGAVVLVRNPHKTRRLTVERKVQETCDTPDFTARCICEDEIGVVLSGYGTTYLLTGYRGKRETWNPSLAWPSMDLGSCVWDVQIEETGEQLVADRSAADLFREVSFDGR